MADRAATKGSLPDLALADLPPRVRLVVLFGGRSAEHEISCISAGHVLAAVDRSRYDVVPIGITREGQFVRSEQVGSGVTEMAAIGPSADLLPVLAAQDDDVPTVVLPILHGPNGEDGTIQGLLEIAGLPYVGAGVLGSAVAMDKSMAKTLLAAAGIDQVRWRTLGHLEALGEDDAVGILGSLGPTVFVKPSNMGSSIGVSRIAATDGATALISAVEQARRYDDLVLIEAGVEAGRELECAVLGNDQPRASVVGEVVTDAEFYDYDDKYFDGTARTVIPAELDPEVSEEARSLAVRTFGALRCSGMARVDMFLTADGRLLVNEANTIPGFTPISMYPKLWQASGLSYSGLIDELVRLALERHGRRAAHEVAPR